MQVMLSMSCRFFSRNGCVFLDIAANVFLFIAVTMRRVERHDVDEKTLIVPADYIGWCSRVLLMMTLRRRGF
jgi:hypothetical protein